MSHNSRDKGKQTGKYLCRLNRSFVLVKHDKITFMYLQGVLISPLPDQEENKLQRQKILSFIYPIYNHNWRIISAIYRVSQEERTKLREGVPYVKLYRYNPKHLYPKLNVYGDNGKRSLKL